MIDHAEFGRRIKALRIMAGHDRVKDAAADIRARTGVQISERTMYAVERGEQLPSLEQFVAMLLLFNPPTGALFFQTAFRPDVVAYVQQQIQQMRGAT